MEYLVTLKDQYGILRTCHVQKARDAVHAAEIGRELLRSWAKMALPAFMTRSMDLVLVRAEPGHLSSEGWVPSLAQAGV